jgi:arginine decarboxylase
MSDGMYPDNNEAYWIRNWGDPYFSVNSEGHVAVRANGNELEGDLYKLVRSLVQRGIDPPILIRFDGIIRDRIQHLQRAFDNAIEEFNYPNSYRIAYPIKVNPQRHVVEQVLHAGSDRLLGLEVGSKPELLAVITLDKNLDALLLCNGYKDAEYIELALLASKLGRRTIIIIEQVYEVKLVLDIANQIGCQAELGFRMRPSSKGSGRWKSSGGDLAKFGLNSHEIYICLEQLRNAGKSDWLKLLHFHIGSQITSIDAIKKAMDEAARMFTELAKVSPCLSFFDAGGGLGVDYDGSKTTSDSSMNYSVEEYARDIVYILGEACVKADVAPPVIITESGRALTAHHAILITEVIDVATPLEAAASIDEAPTPHPIANGLYALYQELSSENCQEVLHDAFELKEKIIEGFIHGTLSLTERAYSEQIYQRLITKIRNVSKELQYIPEDIEDLDKTAFDFYFCNFSVFQSLPDSWAIQQLFPVMPIHRLNEKATRKAIIADLSCDSDGKIDRFVCRRGIKTSINLHEFKPPSPYYLGIFLVGAYQEILGGLHNLFGDANAVHVELDSEGKWNVKDVVEGDTIEEVLTYTQYHPHDILDRLRFLIERSLKSGRLTNEESAKLQKKVKQSLESYTYLVV